MKTPIAFALLFSLLADATPTRQARPDEQIRIRQGGELFMSWNMAKIGEQLGEPVQNFNREEVLRAAQGIAGVANAGLGSLYGPGTEKSVGDTRTRVRAEFFQQPERVRELMGRLATEANQLVKVAQAGDPGLIRHQLARTGETCTACHDNFRRKD